MRRILRKIVAGEGDQLGDLSTLAEPAVVEAIKQKVMKRSWKNFVTCIFILGWELLWKTKICMQ